MSAERLSSRPRILEWFLIASLFLHLLLLTGIENITRWFPAPAARQPLEVELREVWKRQDRRQIVDLPNRLPSEEPDLAKYLSEANQRVKEETQAPRTLPSKGSSGGTVERPARQGSGSAAGSTANLKRADQGPGERPAETDYLERVRRGDQTYINAKAFEHTRYYLEIKRKIEIAWSPERAFHELAERGEWINQRMARTVLGVTLDPSGRLVDIVLLEPSGKAGLDQEAVRSFQSSAPFTRVPEELLEDGVLRFEFGFIISDR